MRTIPPLLLSDLQNAVTTLAICWRVVRKDGDLILGTTCDKNVTVATGDLAGTYSSAAGITGSNISSNSDLSVDNMEVVGKVIAEDDLSITDLRASDIEAGLFDDARVIIFMTNWVDPTRGILTLRDGNIGGITRTSEGRYTSELRGLSQRLRQNLIQTYSVTCNAELGDARCKFPLSTATASGTVDAVTDRATFDSTLSGIASGLDVFIGGLLTWVTGDNAGFSMEVKHDGNPSGLGSMKLYEPMPNDIQVGDTFSVSPGCDKTIETCRDRFDNIVNFRGYGVLVPGRNKIALFGGTV